MTKKELLDLWDELRARAKKVSTYPAEIQEQFKQVSGRIKTYGNLHFATNSSYSKRARAKGIGFKVRHNERLEKESLDYLLPESEQEPNEYTPIPQRAKEILENNYKQEPTNENFLRVYEAEMKNNYLEFHKRKMPKNAQPIIEAILNLEQHHTIQDIAQALERAKFPLNVLHIAIHRDEGKKDEITGEYIKNYHAHILFKNYDYKTHQTILRGLSQREFKECQERLNEALGMEKSPKKNYKHLNRAQLQYRKEKQALNLLQTIKQYEKSQEPTHKEQDTKKSKPLNNDMEL